jgi:parallel beta-helix repeat protein
MMKTKTQWYHIAGVAVFGFIAILFITKSSVGGFNPSSLLAQAVISPTTYYIDSVNGSDSNTGTSPGSAWQTIAKVDTATLNPGDSVLFNKGGTYYGSLTIQQSGTAGNPITIGAYGSGNDPVITGFDTLSGWKNDGGNIWEAPCTNCSPTINIVRVNGVEQPMGRYPNADAANGGYLTIASHNGNASITDPTLAGGPDWTGADIAIRKNNYDIDVSTITSDSGSTLNYAFATSYTPNNGYGYFIENSPKTLDENGEWYYNPATNVIQLYSAENPTSEVVQASSINTLASLDNQSYIDIQNIYFTGSNQNSVSLQNTNNIVMQNCSITFSGIDAVIATVSSNDMITGCTIDQSNNDAIYMAPSVNASYTDSNISITNNTISNTGMIPGMGGTGGDTYSAIIMRGANNSITDNQISNTGYVPIDFNGDGTLIQNNSINNYCMVKDDCGGIYTWSNGHDTASVTRNITGNIILNGVGAVNGANPNGTAIGQANGIYLDDGTINVSVKNNFIQSAARGGIYLHNVQNVTVDSNTIDNAHVLLNVVRDTDVPQSLQGIVITHNNLIGPNNIMMVLQSTDLSSSAQFGIVDNNNYFFPNSNSGVFYMLGNRLNFAAWQSTYNVDPNSKVINDTPLVEYNATASSNNVSLDGTYQDTIGNIVTNTLILPPFGNAVLTPATAPVTLSVTTATPEVVPVVVSTQGYSSGGSSAPVTTTVVSPDTNLNTQPVPTPVTDSNGSTVIPVANIVPQPVASSTASTIISQIFSFIPLTSQSTQPAIITRPVTTTTGPTGVVTGKKNYTIVSIKYYLNNVLVHTNNGTPDGWTINTSSMQDGSYTLSTIVEYGDGSTDTSSSTFTVDNSPTVLQTIGTFIKSLIGKM